jgi:hypothetical protein
MKSLVMGMGDSDVRGDRNAVDRDNAKAVAAPL